MARGATRPDMCGKQRKALPEVDPAERRAPPLPLLTAGIFTRSETPPTRAATDLVAALAASARRIRSPGLFTP